MYKRRRRIEASLGGIPINAPTQSIIITRQAQRPMDPEPQESKKVSNPSDMNVCCIVMSCHGEGSLCTQIERHKPEEMTTLMEIGMPENPPFVKCKSPNCPACLTDRVSWTGLHEAMQNTVIKAVYYQSPHPTLTPPALQPPQTTS
jgi:hypothetical protein